MYHNPYINIDWVSYQQIKSTSHVHVIEQEGYDAVYDLGFRHFATSHYAPSSPYYPIEDFIVNTHSDIISSPNSEKGQSVGGGHINALGSFHSGYGSPSYETLPEKLWQEIYDDILDQLQFEDGGGITLNHPWLDFQHNIDRLDYDERVLGIEIFNNTIDKHEDFLPVGSYWEKWIKMWDDILSTGRRCFGFSVIDWPNENLKPLYGANILLAPTFTEHDALRSYRNGEFYGIIKDTGLRFNSLSLDNKTVSVEINKSATIKFITEKGTEKTVTGTTSDFTSIDNTFVRVEVQEGTDHHARMFSNPFMFKSKLDLEKEEKKRVVRNIIILN